jgi:hypothetical protein
MQGIGDERVIVDQNEPGFFGCHGWYVEVETGD